MIAVPPLGRAVLDTAGQEIRDEPKIEGRIRVYAARVDGLAALAAPATHFDGSLAIEVRGYTSQGFPKKQYGFEVRDAEARDADVSLLGRAAGSALASARHSSTASGGCALPRRPGARAERGFATPWR